MKSLVCGAVLLGALVAAPAAAAPAPVAPPASGPPRAVVVQAADSAAAARAVRAQGGTVTLQLPLVRGVAARVPAAAVARLQQAPGVRAVTPDARVTVQGATSTSTSDVKSVYAEEVGATALRAAGLRGKGVRVALVDTGVSRVPDLEGRIVPVDDPGQRAVVGAPRRQVLCANFSGEPGCDDSYGHGTFLAGLIAGDGTASAGRFVGVAPEAEVVSVKIAGRDGSADVSKVLAAIQWVVSFKDTYDIDVLNLSLGTNSTAPVEVDPLNHAVQRATQAGITVVVAASNRGPAAQTISKPADDPLVLTVGAVDDRETPALSDDRSPAFTGRGPTAHLRAKPDVVAPGVRLVSLRSPGSAVEEHAPGGGVDSAYRRGTGTSMSAAVVSGLVALVREAQPTWTPTQVKAALTATAAGVNTTDRTLVGAGLVQGQRAVAALPALTVPQVTAQGTGSLDDSRADVLVQRNPCDEPCDPTSGQHTEQGLPYSTGGYTDTSWTGNSWYSSQWVALTGNSWYGNSWYGNSWYGNSWYGTEGADPEARPFGLPLPGSAWYGVYQ